jgi:hypothetical protein
MVQTIGLAVIATLATLLAAELVFRAVGYDFSRAHAAQAANPIYYRLPTEPVGPVFFRRPGPDIWVGNVLSEGFRVQIGDEGDPYSAEPVVEVRYDRDGFRNPDDLVDWRPTDLPAYVQEVATRLGRRFIDLTQPFAAEAARGRLLYNGLWDSHLNSAGSRLAGKTIAEALVARGP